MDGWNTNWLDGRLEWQNIKRTNAAMWTTHYVQRAKTNDMKAI